MSSPIALSHVTYRVGRHFALRDLSLSVPQGTVFGLLGPNGSGKTTIIRLITGMAAADDGTVTVAGHLLPRGAAAALGEVGFVPERPHLYPGLSVDDTLRYHRAFFPRFDTTFAQSLLRDFQLRPDMVVGRMSKGETGKVMVLLALATRPSILVLDEPTDGLDPVARRDVMGAVMAYVADTGATMLITSHLVHEIERMCDRVGLLDDGTLVMDETMTAFRDALRRVRVTGAPPSLGALPFTLVARRDAGGRAQDWVIRGFHDSARSWMTAQGMEVLEVTHLDLEETVVELLRASRVTPEVAA